jgi:hypothetical protein
MEVSLVYVVAIGHNHKSSLDHLQLPAGKQTRNSVYTQIYKIHRGTLSDPTDIDKGLPGDTTFMYIAIAPPLQIK